MEELEKTPCKKTKNGINIRRKDEITKSAMQKDDKQAQKDEKMPCKKSHLKLHFLSFCLAFFVISSIYLAFFRNFVFLRGVLSLFHRLAWLFFVFSLGIFFVISSIRLAFFFSLFRLFAWSLFVILSFLPGVFVLFRLFVWCLIIISS